MIHILDAGQSLCTTVSGTPNTWPPGHVWIGIAQIEETKRNPKGHGFCSICLSKVRAFAKKPKLSPLKQILAWKLPIGAVVKVKYKRGEALTTNTESMPFIYKRSAYIRVTGIRGPVALDRVTRYRRKRENPRSMGHYP